MPRTAVLLLVLPLAASAAAPRARGDLPSAAVLRQAGPALVTVRYVLQQAGGEFDGFTQRSHLRAGGFFVRPDGLVLVGGEIFPETDVETDQPARLVDFEIVRGSGEVLPADLAGFDEAANVAFVKTRQPGPYPFVRFDPSYHARVGDQLLAVGRLPEGYGYLPVVRPVQVAARLPSGELVTADILDVRFLGGPLYSARGEAIGVIGVRLPPPGVDPQQESEYFPMFVATVPRGKRFGMPVGVPASSFSPSIQSPPPVPEPGGVEKAWIGITLQSVSRDLARYWGVPAESGIAVTSVIEGSPADQAGLREGDVILSYNGEPVRAEQDADLDLFIKKVQRSGVGRDITLQVFRGGDLREVKLPLGKAPVPMRTAPSYTSRDFGLKVRDITFDFLQRRNLPRDLRGVVVEELEAGGWAQVGGLQEGDVIRQVQQHPIASVEDLREALGKAREGKAREVVFFVQRGVNTLFVSVRTEY